MTREFASHAQPAPVIKDAAMVVEEVSGDLSTTYTLVGMLMSEVEKLQERQRAGQVQPAAIDVGLSSAWALAETISNRVRDNCTMLDAVTDQANRHQLQAA